MEEIRQLLQIGVEQGDFPGANYAIITRKGIVDEGYVGYKSLIPSVKPLEGNEIYDCASLTKVISTTTLIFHLIEEGKLSLETTVSDLLKDFRHKKIKIKHLLAHCSGLPADISQANTLKNKADVEERIYSMDLLYETGKKVLYSDIGFILLGWMIEEVTKKTLDVVASEVIFTKINMIDTSYHPSPFRVCPTEMRYDEVYQGLLCGHVHDEKAFALGGTSGHAGLFSTAHDIGKFLYHLLINDGTILQKETVDALFVPRIYDLESEVPKIRSFGWDKPTSKGSSGSFTDFDGTILHTGFTGCNCWIDKKHGIAFVMLSNAVHPKRERNNIFKYRTKIADIILTSMGVNII